MSASTPHSTFTPNGIVTLTSDFGSSEPYVGLMKGVILSRCPQARLIDLTHQIPVYRSSAAGLWLARSWQYFPTGTVHLAVVDPGVGTERGMVLLRQGGQVFVAPDNGLLDTVAVGAADAHWFRIEPERLQAILPPRPSRTFHGRDIFAPLVAELAAGRLQPEQVGAALRREPKTSIGQGSATELTGQIVVIDHFGNLITDIDAAAVERLVNPTVHFREQTFVLQPTYGAVAAGRVLALINSFGVIELAQAQGSAQQLFAADYGETVVVRGIA